MKWPEVALALGLVTVLAVIAVLFVGTQTSTILETRSGAISLPPNRGASSGDGYWDYPEGATPVPTPDASAAALGVALHVDHLDVPLDHTGTYAIPVGEAVLPNGYLTEYGVRVANGEDGSYLTRGIRLDIRTSPEASPYAWNAYEQGVVDGPQRVQVTVTFDVKSFNSGAVIRLEDIVVR